MNEYNDYISITKRWFKSYNTFKVTVASMTADIETQERMLASADDLGAPIAKYDSMPKGGSGELNAVERQTEDRLRRQQEINRAKLNRDEIQRIIDRLDRAMESLPQEDRELLHGHYMMNRDWCSLGYERHYSERWAREKAGKALRTVAFMLFGVKAQPMQLSFVFAE